MKETNFYIFKKNTEAVSINKGFYYQYLITLRLWLTNLNNGNLEIYCETEDDILEFDKKTLSRKYTQIKCYSSGFSLKSPEVVKSLLNFYNLFLKYEKNYSGIYKFSTSASIKPKAGKILLRWYEGQKEGSTNIDEFISPTREALINYILKVKGDFLKKCADEKEVYKIDKKVSGFIDNVMSPNFASFIKQIRWEFRENEEDEIKVLTEDIANLLNKTNYNRNINIDIIISYLLHEIIKKTTQHEIKNRILDKKGFNKLIENTYNENIVLKNVEKNTLQIIKEILSISKQVREVKRDTDKILKAVLNKKLHASENLLEHLEQNLKDWFNAIDYSIGEIYKTETSKFYFTINVPERRKTLQILVCGILRPIGVAEIELLEKLRDHYNCDEGWLISTSYPTPSAIAMTNNNKKGQILCYNFDELLEQTIDFSNYFNWVEKEIKEKKIDKRYIPIAAKKGEFDITTREVKAVNIYGEEEGWLEGYIDTWLQDKQKEHISILGEFGTGKTWFALYYTWQQIKKYKNAKEKRLPIPRIPILIPLRDFSKALHVDVLVSDFFFRKHKIEIKGVFSAFERLNEMGKLLLIFDGFDEMAEKIDKQKMIDNFWELANIVTGQSKVILTCRNEHFSNIIEGRTLLSAEYKNLTKHLTNETPQFEVIELLKFNIHQIRKVLSFITTQSTINLIFKYNKITDLLARPIMSELIIDAIKEIEAGKEINLSSIYFYATRQKMERDILQNRTFTSLNDKIFFMCEVAWEMLSKNKLSISFKEFPEIIYKYFHDKIEDKEMDYWRYDMRSQSMLIVDDENGSYRPAHKSFLEFFVALKFAYELGVVKTEFLKDINGNILTNYSNKASINDLKNTFGLMLLTNHQMYTVQEFLTPLIKKETNILWELYEQIHGQPDNKYLENNLIFLLTQTSSDFVNKKLNNLNLISTSFENLNLSGTDFENTTFNGGSIINCDLDNSTLENVKFNFNNKYDEGGVPALFDINGENEFDFADNDKYIVSVGRFGINSTPIDGSTAEFQQVMKLKDKDIFIDSLITIQDPKLVCYVDAKKLIIHDIEKNQELVSKEVFNSFFVGIKKCKSGNRFITYSDSSTELGSLAVWDVNNLKNPTEFNFKNRGIFGACFSKSKTILAGGRDGILFSIDIDTGKAKVLVDRSVVNASVKEISPNSSIGISEYIYDLSLNPEETILAIGTTIRALVLWDYEKNEIFKLLNTKKRYVTKVEFSLDGKYLAYLTEFGDITLVSTKTWKKKKTYRGPFNKQIKFSANGKYLALGTYEGAEIQIIELDKLKIIKKFSFKLKFQNLNIKGLAAPIWYIRFYIERGAIGWYNETELLNLPIGQYNRLIKLLQYGDSKKNKSIPREKQVKQIIQYVYKN